MKYKVIKDTREQEGWSFAKSDNCEGTEIATLPTGDYSIAGYEHLLCIERKGSVAEFANNIVEKRFERELVRMEGFAHAFMILEFEVEDIINFPASSNIPKWKWGKLRVSNWFILKRLMDFQTQYKTKIMLVGKRGKEVVASLFKRIVEKHEKKTDEGTAEATGDVPGRVSKSGRPVKARVRKSTKAGQSK